MRIWSVHPRFLDRQGLVACWRETLLAQAVMAGRTRGYTRHPQLNRFRESEDPLGLIGAYLGVLASEATERGYRFDRSRIDVAAGCEAVLPLTDGQLAYEWQHLGSKLMMRSPERAELWRAAEPAAHPLFHLVPGPISDWERP